MIQIGFNQLPVNIFISFISISGLVVEYIVAIDVTRVRLPADAYRCRLKRKQRKWPSRSRVGINSERKGRFFFGMNAMLPKYTNQEVGERLVFRHTHYQGAETVLHCTLLRHSFAETQNKLNAFLTPAQLKPLQSTAQRGAAHQRSGAS